MYSKLNQHLSIPPHLVPWQPLGRGERRRGGWRGREREIERERERERDREISHPSTNGHVGCSHATLSMGVQLALQAVDLISF
jgi:hypothetical protein